MKIRVTTLLSLLFLTTLACKPKPTAETKLASEEGEETSIEEIRAICSKQPDKCIPHMAIGAGGPIPCRALYNFAATDANGNILAEKPSVWAFDELRREYRALGRTKVAALIHDKSYSHWPVMQSYEELPFAEFGDKTPDALRGLPIGVRAEGATGKYIYRPVAYVIKVKNRILDDKDNWVVFRVLQAKQQLLEYYDSDKRIPPLNRELEIKNGEFCEAAYTVPVDSGGKSNGQPQLNTALDAANFVIDPIRNGYAQEKLAETISYLGFVAPIGAALTLEAGCFAHEGSCGEAIAFAIADGAALAIPFADKALKGVAVWARKAAVVTNVGAGSYAGLRAVQELHAGNTGAATSYAFQGIFRLAIGGFFHLEARTIARRPGGVGNVAAPNGGRSLPAPSGKLYSSSLDERIEAILRTIGVVRSSKESPLQLVGKGNVKAVLPNKKPQVVTYTDNVDEYIEELQANLSDLVPGTKMQDDLGRDIIIKEVKGKRVTIEEPGVPGEFFYDAKSIQAQSFVYQLEITPTGIPPKQIKLNIPAKKNNSQDVRSLNKITKVLEDMPAKDLEAIDEIFVYSGNQGTGRNFWDAYWAREYQTPNFTSAATGGERRINYFPAGLKGGDFAELTAHELGHNVALKVFGSTTPGPKWLQAMKADGVDISAYAGTNDAEDFAEHFAAYVSYQSGTLNAKTASKFSNRFKVLDDIEGINSDQWLADMTATAAKVAATKAVVVGGSVTGSGGLAYWYLKGNDGSIILTDSQATDPFEK